MLRVDAEASAWSPNFRRTRKAPDIERSLARESPQGTTRRPGVSTLLRGPSRETSPYSDVPSLVETWACWHARRLCVYDSISTRIFGG